MDELFGGEAGPPPPAGEPAASPHLAPDPEPAPAPRRRPSAATAGAVAAGAIVLALVAWGLAPRGTSMTLAGADKGQVLEPLQPTADLRTGEQIAPFAGFAVTIETEPPGAVVTIGGVPRGEAPVLANLDCAPGDRIEIAAEKAGFPVARTQTTCRADALVKLKVRLRR